MPTFAAGWRRPASRPPRAARRSLAAISRRRSSAGAGLSARKASKANRNPIDQRKAARKQRGSPLNPLRDQPSRHQLEAGMIIQMLAMAFILAFGAIVILGHVLLALAVFTPVRAGNSQTV